MLTILSYKTNWKFLAFHVCKYQLINVNIGDSLQNIIDANNLSGTILFQINLSNYRNFFSDTDDPHLLLEQVGCKVLNRSLYDISKSKIQNALISLDLPALKVDKESLSANEKVMIKSNLNYGGLFERELPVRQRIQLGIDYDFSLVPTFDGYQVMSAKEVPPIFWEHRGISVERFIENDRGSYTRIYKFKNQYVFSQALMPGVIIKKMNHRKHEAHLLVNSYDIDLVENVEQKNALSTAAAFLQRQNIDLATVDMITNNQGVHYIFDLNHTPYWGKINDHHFIDHLAYQDEL